MLLAELMRYLTTRAVLYGDRRHGHVLVRSAVAVGGGPDLVDDVHAFDDLAEHGCSRCHRDSGNRAVHCLTTLRKTAHLPSPWSPRRAIASVPRSFFKPLRLSRGWCRALVFPFMSAVNPPP